ncbi:MAG: ParM/StbA family protein [Faecalibacterium sp.]|jgi:plasmid segregation protein ParM|nr:ParM/StbA family protein [Faecalibacterium sp.]
MKNSIIIGIDHGYGNIKTAHHCFKSGVTASETEPTFRSSLLICEGRYYQIGDAHKEFVAAKMQDQDYYILTLAAVAAELHDRHLQEASVHLAAGLPLTWVSTQKEEFRAYLLQNREVTFNFKSTDYHVEFTGADIFPQGFAAVADHLHDFTGINMLADIGNGTMNLMYINERRPVAQKCYTEKFGVNQCVLAVREHVLKEHGTVMEEALIERILRHGTADIDRAYLETVRNTAAEYVAGIFAKLREREYNPALMRLYLVGGGSCLVRNFGQYDVQRVFINEDICATAKGYETLALKQLRRMGG